MLTTEIQKLLFKIKRWLFFWSLVTFALKKKSASFDRSRGGGVWVSVTLCVTLRCNHIRRQGSQSPEPAAGPASQLTPCNRSVQLRATVLTYGLSFAKSQLGTRIFCIFAVAWCIFGSSASALLDFRIFRNFEKWKLLYYKWKSILSKIYPARLNHLFNSSISYIIR